MARFKTETDSLLSPHALQRLDTESIDIRLSSASQYKWKDHNLYFIVYSYA